MKQEPSYLFSGWTFSQILFHENTDHDWMVQCSTMLQVCLWPTLQQREVSGDGACSRVQRCISTLKGAFSFHHRPVHETNSSCCNRWTTLDWYHTDRTVWLLPPGTDCLVICGPGSAGLLVGLNDLKGLWPPKWFYESMLYGRHSLFSFSFFFFFSLCNWTRSYWLPKLWVFYLLFSKIKKADAISVRHFPGWPPKGTDMFGMA